MRASLPSLWTEVRLRVTLLWYKPSCFSNVNYYVIMLTRFWSLSQQGHLQPYSKSKAWQLIHSCKMVYSLKPWEVNTSVTKSLYSSQVAILVSIACKDWEYCHKRVHLKVAFYQASLTFWWYPFVLNSHYDRIEHFEVNLFSQQQINKQSVWKSIKKILEMDD